LEFLPLYHRAFGQVFEKAREEDQKRYSKNQSKALMLLNDHGAMLPSRLGSCLNLQRGSLTSMVDSLAESGYVEREPDEEDRRKVWIRLTENGKFEATEQRTILQKRLAQRLSQLDLSNQKKLHQGLELVLETLHLLVTKGTTEPLGKGVHHG